MTQVICYQQNGKQLILNPSPFCELTLEKIAEKDVPSGCPWEIVNFDDLPVAELTPEELRTLMPPISKRQLRLTLVRNGISLADLDAAILTMGDEAIIEWQDASEYRRLHPLLNQVAAHLSLSHEQVDGMWQQALSA